MATDAHKTAQAVADYAERQIKQRRTSITAHVVQSVAVTMSFAELDTLCDFLAATGPGNASHAQADVIDELLRAVREVT